MRFPPSLRSRRAQILLLAGTALVLFVAQNGERLLWVTGEVGGASSVPIPAPVNTCLSDANCQDPAFPNFDPDRPYCSAGTCYACVTDAHCTGNPAGEACVANSCTCKVGGFACTATNQCCNGVDPPGPNQLACKVSANDGTLRCRTCVAVGDACLGGGAGDCCVSPDPTKQSICANNPGNFGKFCTLSSVACGNGEKQEGEECDDGNTVNGDGCTAKCTKENYYCIWVPESEHPTCRNKPVCTSWSGPGCEILIDSETDIDEIDDTCECDNWAEPPYNSDTSGAPTTGHWVYGDSRNQEGGWETFGQCDSVCGVGGGGGILVGTDGTTGIADGGGGINANGNQTAGGDFGAGGDFNGAGGANEGDGGTNAGDNGGDNNGGGNSSGGGSSNPNGGGTNSSFESGTSLASDGSQASSRSSMPSSRSADSSAPASSRASNASARSLSSANSARSGSSAVSRISSVASRSSSSSSSLKRSSRSSASSRISASSLRSSSTSSRTAVSSVSRPGSVSSRRNSSASSRFSSRVSVLSSRVSSASSASRRSGFSSSRCLNNDQCPGGDACVNGICVASSASSRQMCTTATQCPTGLCQNGFCTSCTSNNQCPLGLCQEGICVECFSNEQCASGICIDHRCTVATNPFLISFVPDDMPILPPSLLCGNSRLDADEECDDGNTQDLDSCSAYCLWERGVCGDGVRQRLLGEQCEPSISSLVPCGNDCRFILNSCGDGRMQAGEACDEGRLNSNVPGSVCRPDCSSGRCGDLIRDPGEACDDGNRLPGDGCDAFCRAERSSGTQTLPAQVIDVPFFGAEQTPPVYVEQPPQVPQVPQTTESGPAGILVMASGAAAGYAWMRRRRG